jgi:hypothetical protein
MLEAVARHRAERRRRGATGRLTPLDDCACWYCLKRFGKVDWLRARPETDWARDLLGESTQESVRFRLNQDATETPLDDGDVILLNEAAALSYTLNKTGVCIWRLLGEGLTADEAATRLAETFDVTPEAARADVARFIDDLRALDLVRLDLPAALAAEQDADDY